jgi:ATP-binding cassette subfamily A (ABC1) protein 1
MHDGDDSPQYESVTGLSLLILHFQAMLEKRLLYAMRDKKAQICNTVAPSIVLLIALSIVVYASVAQDNPPYLLDNSDFNPSSDISAADKVVVPFLDTTSTAASAYPTLAQELSSRGGRAYERDLDQVNAEASGAVFGVSYRNGYGDCQNIVDSDTAFSLPAVCTCGFAEDCRLTSGALSIPCAAQAVYQVQDPAQPIWSNLSACPAEGQQEDGPAQPLPLYGLPGHVLALSRDLVASAETMEASTYGAFAMDSDPASLSRFNYYILQNTTARHAAALFMNTLTNAYYSAINPDSPVDSEGRGVRVTNHPLPLTLRYSNAITAALSFIATIFIMIAFAFIPGGMILFIVREREAHHNSKHQQLISGVSIVAYWLSTYAFDLLNYMVPFSMALILIQAFQFGGYIDDGAFPAVAMLFLGYGVAVAPFSYCMSYLFSKHTSAQIYVILFKFLTGLVLMITAFVMNLVESTTEINSKLVYFYFIFPGFCLGWGLFQVTTARSFGGGGPLKSAFAMDVAGTAITYLFVEALIYLLLAITIDLALSYPKFKGACTIESSVPAAVLAEGDEDDDVLAEEERVRSGASREAGDIVILDALRKVYPPLVRPKVAVRQLSYGIPPGECFGFLGINGAGKTSTLKMLTGDVLPTEGNAYIAGKDILTQQLEVRSLLGYCPQFDALLDLLTVREHLELFAKVKGIPQSHRSALVRQAMVEMDLTNFENKLAGRLSGGNKRKLSVGIAMIGNPPIMFLDEPSTGMDPVARRYMWSVIAKMSTRSKDSSVVLTTHSMEEAEALCSRVGIMVGGRLRCLGSCQHLKNKFGQGLMLEIKLEQVSAEEAATLYKQAGQGPDDKAMGAVIRASLPELIHAHSLYSICSALGKPERAMAIQQKEESAWMIWHVLDRDGSISSSALCQWWIAEDLAEALSSFIVEGFRIDGAPAASNPQMVERHESLMRFRLPDLGEKSLADVFEAIEDNKTKLRMQEYSVSQTSLEQIFNQFASQQDEEKGGARGIVGTGTGASMDGAAPSGNPLTSAALV